ncbi:glycosyltransferase family protein [Aquipuribacter sp. SD81]|uniref:glycosyltransferase family protein n=1 Tax=Aquipuribacter sp. SD81 TaxID=3127703 RepID=UPI003019DA9C
MRIAFVDDILERHVLSSLERALRARGHEVLTTGALWHGDRAPSDPEDVARVDAALEDVLAWRPDAALTPRVATLSQAQVARLRARGVVTVGWLPDDPVLFRASTGRRAPWYDVTLHTGGEAELELYAGAGVHGVSFPFFTDEVAFPPVGLAPGRYRGAGPELGTVFLGNTHTRVKRWRHEWLRASGAPVTVVGQTAEDQSGLPSTLAADDREVARVLARARYGVTMSQRFADYAGTRYDFPGLADLGVFAVPSRVVQLAASGVPIIAKVDDEVPPFPCVVVREPAELGAAVARLDADPRAARDLAARAHAWFRSGFHADGRALLLEQLLADPGWVRGTPASHRARLYRTVTGGAPGRVGRRRS